MKQKPIRVVVASTCIHKVEAVRDAMKVIFTSTEFTVEGISGCESGVNPTPWKLTIIEKGARNRMKALRELEPNADFFVSIENGLVDLDNSEFGSAVVDLPFVLVNDSQATSESYALGVGVKVPQPIAYKVMVSLCKETVGTVAKELNPNIDPQDPHSTWTNNFISRKAIIAQAVVVAFGQLVGQKEENSF